MNKSQQDAPELSKAMAFLQERRFEEAISIYEKILRRDPRNVAAANLLGVALMQCGRFEEAVSAIRDGLRINPAQAGAHYNLAIALQALGRFEEAVGHLQQAVSQKPDDPQAYNNLGVALKSAGRLEEAVAAYDKALTLNAGYAEASGNLAAVLYLLKRYSESIEQARKALALNPNLPEAHLSIGNSLRAEGRIEEALPSIDRAIALQPNRSAGYISAGSGLMDGGYHERAIPHFERAIALEPDAVALRFKLASCLYLTARYEQAETVAKAAFSRLPSEPGAEDEVAIGSFLLEADRHEQAIAHLEKALQLNPGSATAHLGYGRALETAGRYEEALQHLDRALALEPRSDMVRFNKGLLSLSIGKFRDGWELLEMRFAEGVLAATPRPHNAPRWDGKKLAGTLAIWGEQGLGDQLLYGTMIPDAMKNAGGIILEVEPRLVSLFARSFPDAEVRSLTGDISAIHPDAHTPAGGLGAFYRQAMPDFPSRAYLVADQDRAVQLKSRLYPNKTVIGVSWRSTNKKIGIHKTAELRNFSSLFTRPDVQLVDLQYGDTSAEREAIRQEFGVEILHLDEIDNMNDIDGLAALINACDAVLTVSNTTAHIAGALGRPVWILVPQAQGRLWYWFREGKKSPWYPEAQLVRQQGGQSWGELVASAAPEILDFVRERNAKRV